MWVMISGDGQDVNLRPVPQIDFTPLKRDSAIATKPRIKVEPPITKTPPEIPVIEHSGFYPGETIPNINRGVPGVVPTDGIDAGGADQDVMPLVRINPVCPRRQQTQGIEGLVQFEFSITPAGTVSGVRVLDSKPKGVFEDAATKAIQRWKYYPKPVDGRAVERLGIRVVLRFDLED